MIKNPDMHPTLAAVMKPIHDRGIEFNISKLCKEANIKFEELPHTGPVKACYRWILGYCGTTNECGRGLTHCPGKAIPDEAATAIANAVAPGVAKIVNQFDAEQANKKPKEEK